MTIERSHPINRPGSRGHLNQPEYRQSSGIIRQEAQKSPGLAAGPGARPERPDNHPGRKKPCQHLTGLCPDKGRWPTRPRRNRIHPFLISHVEILNPPGVGPLDGQEPQKSQSRIEHRIAHKGTGGATHQRDQQDDGDPHAAPVKGGPQPGPGPERVGQQESQREPDESGCIREDRPAGIPRTGRAAMGLMVHVGARSRTSIPARRQRRRLLR